MTRDEILTKMRTSAAPFPPKLRAMVWKYSEAIAEGLHTPHLLCRHGANLLHSTFKKADAGDAETLARMQADGINAIAMAAAVDLFTMAEMEFEEEARNGSDTEGRSVLRTDGGGNSPSSD